MKKIITTLLILTVIVTGVFAASIDDKTISSGIAATPYYPLSPKTMGMGGAGVATPLRTDAFWINPAGLARRPGRSFQMSLPYADVTLFNVYNYVKPGAEGGPSVVDQIIDIVNGGGDPTQIINPLLESFTAGKNKVAAVDAGISFTGGGFGLTINTRANIHDFGNATGGASSELFAEIEAAVSMGYAHRISFTDNFSLDLGGIVRFNYLAYSGMVGATDLVGVISGGDPMTLVNTLPLAAGWAVSGDVGLLLNIPFGFRFGATVRNISTNYRMAAYDNYEKYLSGWQDSFSTDPAFMLTSPLGVDVGIGWQLENIWFKPTLAVDFVDMVGLFENTEELADARTWLGHLRLGLDLRLLAFLEVRAGLNAGYWSLGAGLDFGIVNVEAAYYIQEFGESIGDKPLDALQLRVNIGFDR